MSREYFVLFYLSLFFYTLEATEPFLCYVKCLAECQGDDCSTCLQILTNASTDCSLRRDVRDLMIQKFELDSSELYKPDRPHETELTWVQPDGANSKIYYIIQWRTQIIDPWKILSKVITTANFNFKKDHPCGIYQLRVAAISEKGMGDFTEVKASGPGKVHWSERPQIQILRKVWVSHEKINVTIGYTLPTDWKYPNVSFNINWLGHDACKVTRIEKSLKRPVEVYSVPRKCRGIFVVDSYRYRCSEYAQRISAHLGAPPKSLNISPNNCKGIEGCHLEKCRHAHFCGNSISYKLDPQKPGSCLNETDMNVSWSYSHGIRAESYKMCKPAKTVLIIGNADDRVTSGVPEAHPMKDVIHQFTLPASENQISNVTVASGSKLILISCSIFNESGLNSKEFETSKTIAHRAVILVPKADCFEEIPKVKGSNLHLALGVAIPLGAALLVLLVVICIACRKNRQNVSKIKMMQSSMNDYQSFGTPEVPDKWEIDRRLLIVNDDETLGKGAFGKVCKGKIIGKAITSALAKSSIATDQELAENMVVAVKQCHEYADEATKRDFLQEIELMKELYYNPMLINILHCITITEPYSLIVEYCPLGDLCHYLRTRRKYMTELRDAGLDLSSTEVPNDVDLDMIVSFNEVASMSYQIAHGMEYISQKGYIHRDLAARNIMMADKGKVKIGDFGLCRYVYTDAYMAKGGKLPIKWLALEAIERYEFSTKSDVWSFGILLFEIITLGGTPYPDVMPLDGDFRLAMLKHLKEGNRMKQPPNCPDEYYQLMKSCWKQESEDRPNFGDLKENLRKVVEELSEGASDYYPFSYIDLSKGYYNVISDSDSKDNFDDIDLNEETNKTSMEDLRPNLQPMPSSLMPEKTPVGPVSSTESGICVDQHTELTTRSLSLGSTANSAQPLVTPENHHSNSRFLFPPTAETVDV